MHRCANLLQQVISSANVQLHRTRMCCRETSKHICTIHTNIHIQETKRVYTNFANIVCIYIGDCKALQVSEGGARRDTTTGHLEARAVTTHWSPPLTVKHTLKQLTAWLDLAVAAVTCYR